MYIFLDPQHITGGGKFIPGFYQYNNYKKVINGIIKEHK